MTVACRAAGGRWDGGGGGGFFLVVVACSYEKVGRDAGEGACTCSMLRAAIRSLIEAAMVSITLQEKDGHQTLSRWWLSQSVGGPEDSEVVGKRCNGKPTPRQCRGTA